MEDNKIIYYQSVLNNLETLIKENRFKSKEELNKYLLSLKQRGIPEDILSKEKIKLYLDMYDKYNKEEEAKLNMQNYKAVSLENKNMIVSKQEDQVLKTNNSKEEMPSEFKKTQNEITTANSQNELANAQEVFNHLKNNKKEELKFIPVTEAINSNISDIEILNKIKFFISNKYINPYSYTVNINNGIFYNKETKEVFEVRKNKQTGNFEIYKGAETVYQEENSQSITQNEKNKADDSDFEKEEDLPEEEKAYEKDNTKVRRLIKPNTNSSAAFIKTTFLVIALSIMAICVSLFLTVLILLNK